MSNTISNLSENTKYKTISYWKITVLVFNVSQNYKEAHFCHIRKINALVNHNYDIKIEMMRHQVTIMTEFQPFNDMDI